MELLPINEHLHENEIFVNHPDCRATVAMCVDFYKKVGFNPPWICYYAELDGQLVGGAAYKGGPINGRVELAYVTFPRHRQKGVGNLMVSELVKLSQATDPSIIVIARTLAEVNYSTRILQKNNFRLMGTVMDDEHGEVWEWVFYPPASPETAHR